jgi:uncharacterized membrane protein
MACPPTPIERQAPAPSGSWTLQLCTLYTYIFILFVYVIRTEAIGNSYLRYRSLDTYVFSSRKSLYKKSDSTFSGRFWS